MPKARLTRSEVFDRKFQEMKALVPNEAHPFLNSIKNKLHSIDEKYQPLYSQAVQDEAPAEHKDFIRLRSTYEIKSMLDEYVVGQHDAKKVMAQVSFYHMAHLKRELETQRVNDDYIKSSILLIGPTGTGKTLLSNTLSKILQVPFVKVDATSMTKTGFVGDSIQDAVRELYYITDNNLPKAECGIILVDEVDKLAGGSRDDTISNSMVTGRGVQQELLRPMENSKIDLFSHTNIHSIREMMQGGDPDNKKISTRNILFLLAGAFEGIEEVILKRKRKESGHTIGFGHSAPLTLQDVSLQDVQPEDLIEYGLIPELVGRITYIVHLDRLDSEQLFRVLRYARGSISQQIEENVFQTTGKKLVFTDAALQTIATKAAEMRTGGRALMEITSRVMNEFLFHLPTLELEQFNVTPEFVNHYLDATNQLIVRPHIQQAMRKYPFLLENVEWNDSATEFIVKALSEKRLVSVHKYVEDFMTAWAPILQSILHNGKKVVINDQALKLFEDHSAQNNEKLFELLNTNAQPLHF